MKTKQRSVSYGATALVAAIFFTGCMDDTKAEPTQSTNSTKSEELLVSAQQPQALEETLPKELKMADTNNDAQGIVSIKGQIVFNEFEGGFYGFIADDGSKYTPMQMDKAHQRDGLIVEITGQLMPNMMTITQYGTVLKVNSVKVIDDTQAKSAGRATTRPEDL
jgi:hypothetical protein